MIWNKLSPNCQSSLTRAAASTGIALVLTALLATESGAQCPSGSVQARVQPNITTPWTQSLTVDVGQPFRVGGFYDHSGLLSSCVGLQLNSLNLFGQPANGQYVWVPTGTYTLRVFYGAMSDNAYIFVRGCSTPTPSASRLGWPLPGTWGGHGSWHREFGSPNHLGDDIHAQDWQNTPDTAPNGYVYSPIAGTVLYAGTSGYAAGYGDQVVIKSSQSPTMAVRVAHLTWHPVYVGQTINVGDLVGIVGNSGGQPTRHLHIALYRDIDKTATSYSARSGEANLALGAPPTGFIGNYASMFAQQFSLDAAGCWNQ